MEIRPHHLGRGGTGCAEGAGAMSVTLVGSHPNNYMQGRDGHAVRLVVIHATQGSLQSAANWFNNPKAKVSAHYGVGKNGEVEMYVAEKDTAFHAGNWEVNLESIGIEFEDVLDGKGLSTAQEAKGARLIADILRRHVLPPDGRTMQPHRNFRATKCPGDVDVPRLIRTVRGLPLLPTERPHLETVELYYSSEPPFVLRHPVVVSVDGVPLEQEGKKLQIRLIDEK